MAFFDEKEIEEILLSSRIGLWKVEFEEGMTPRFYADSVMDSLLGTHENMTPEERFVFHGSHIHPEDVPLFMEYSDNLKKKMSEVVYRYIHPKYGEMFVRCGGACDTAVTDRVVLKGTHQDISETVRMERDRMAEERLADMHQALRKVQDAQEQLKAATEAAERANAAKTNFLFNMSHDIRTPMNAIIGFTDLLEKHQTDAARRKDYLRKIQDSSAMLLSIINNVLEMARIENGTLELEESPWNVSQFYDSVFYVFQDLMQQKDIEFTMSLDVSHLYAYMDPIKMREILLNVLSNAYKYTPAGGKVTLTVEECPVDEASYTVYKTRISDTGIGMSEEFLPHLFEEFTREHTSTENKVQGTGLGMPIVKKLLMLMGGTIEVESRQNEGTTFTITTPLRLAEESALQQDDADLLHPMDFRGRRILLTEDNELNAEIAMEILGEAGFEVDHAEDGQVCIDMLLDAAPGTYDLILMDIQMPRVNGYEATARIRDLDDPLRSGIPIIALTANAFEEDRRNALEAGMNGHLAKPIVIPDLMQMLASILA